MPDPFVQHSGIAAVLLRDNIDTDQIIPSREMKTVSRSGLSDGLFAGWRYLDPATRTKDPNFILNRPGQSGSTVLVSGENFGCGSSREHAVWALKEYGIRAIIASSFGEIFHGNCIRNGVLPIVLGATLVAELSSIKGAPQVSINLEVQSISCAQLPDWTHQFEISQFAKRLLTLGLDPIALTLTQSEQIDAYQAQDRRQRPWVYSAA